MADRLADRRRTTCGYGRRYGCRVVAFFADGKSSTATPPDAIDHDPGVLDLARQWNRFGWLLMDNSLFCRLSS